jgi:putative SOS response-associated peptidase YedK
MCGRFVLNVDPAMLQTAFDLSSVPQFAPRYNIAPTQAAPVITNENPKDAELYQWGLIPSWAKDVSVGSKMINARAETVEEKPAFRAAFKRRRCIIPASGFYEWQQRDDGKQPMYIHLKDDPLFGMAGLWEVWRDPEGKELRTFTILTTAANDFMRPIHDRMPVILKPEHYALWLEVDEQAAPNLRDLFKGVDADDMTAHDVSKAVNRPAVDMPNLILPV